MLQGTASHVGKTVLAAALGRLFQRAGWRVAPFKAQNLSLNAAVADGPLPTDRPGEIGWAQALQAAACRIPASLDMNPVLLKPTAGGCQVVVRGRVWANVAHDAYGSYSPEALQAARESLDRLRAAYDLVLIEGAGSPAEINLLDRDLANRWTADQTDGPILLVGDISRGGVFAALLGTWMLSPHQARIRGFLINKLHGGAASLDAGLRELEARTGVPTMGVIPVADPALPEEDSLGLERGTAPAAPGTLVIGVVLFPHISNFTDFDELGRQSGVRLFYSWRPEELRAAHVLILPGTKSTVADLHALRAQRLDEVILDAAQSGKPVLGICGGYQMLGREIADPIGIESDLSRTLGLGLLPVDTEFLPEKRTEAAGTGYFIHHGHCRRFGAEPLYTLADGSPEGCRCGRVAGTSLHGALRPAMVAQWRAWAGLPEVACEEACTSLDQRLDQWADHVGNNISWQKVVALLGRENLST